MSKNSKKPMILRIYLVECKYCKTKFDYCAIETNVFHCDVKMSEGCKIPKYRLKYNKTLYLENF